ncbi:redoxin domain-containing protein [Cellulophaga sp. HaHaR_3_176]|uniref:TlpA family protein disulfide reductase n=1 Tax=Cellulophaga sp. HaHaR_3_176 TaxID=1942464 RepID=UPI001C1F786C|nr:TlpA disulfide reductase family protein [Cellulophaga sp. HaHaR_3_176]QWX85004.1 redoxin domain-containing protein [Cellulophaga sp. HaHaR_3_176]
MKLRILALFLIFISFSNAQSNSNETAPKKKTSEINKTIPILNFSSLEPLLHTKSDKIYIVNFWAMWCAPCIKELPVFQEYEKNNPNVEVLLVSLDFPEDVDTKLKPFLKKKGITSNVVLLDDPDANSWIDKVNPKWSGAIPFTIIFNNENRSYHERPFNDIQDLENEINKTIKNK